MPPPSHAGKSPRTVDAGASMVNGYRAREPRLASVDCNRCSAPSQGARQRGSHEVRRRFAAGLSLVRHQTTAEWLEEWTGKRGVARTTCRSYEGHVRLHLRPHLGEI